jgi:hypothetical protein
MESAPRKSSENAAQRAHYGSHRLRQDAKRKPSKDGFFFVYLIGEYGKNTVQRAPLETG